MYTQNSWLFWAHVFFDVLFFLLFLLYTEIKYQDKTAVLKFKLIFQHPRFFSCFYSNMTILVSHFTSQTWFLFLLKCASLKYPKRSLFFSFFCCISCVHKSLTVLSLSTNPLFVNLTMRKAGVLGRNYNAEILWFFSLSFVYTKLNSLNLSFSLITPFLLLPVRTKLDSF